MFKRCHVFIQRRDYSFVTWSQSMQVNIHYTHLYLHQAGGFRHKVEKSTTTGRIVFILNDQFSNRDHLRENTVLICCGVRVGRISCAASQAACCVVNCMKNGWMFWRKRRRKNRCRKYRGNTHMLCTVTLSYVILTTGGCPCRNMTCLPEAFSFSLSAG